MRIKILKWYLSIDLISVAFADHECMNKYMGGTYDCEYCYPEGTD